MWKRTKGSSLFPGRSRQPQYKWILRRKALSTQKQGGYESTKFQRNSTGRSRQGKTNRSEQIGAIKGKEEELSQSKAE